MVTIVNVKFPLLALFAMTCFLLASVNSAGAAGIEEELRSLTGRIQEKINAGKRTEGDLGPELQQIDSLVAQYRDSDAEAAAKTLVMKATLYHMVFQDNARSSQILQEILDDFPDSQTALKLQARAPKREAMPIPSPSTKSLRDPTPSGPQPTYQSELRNLKSRIQSKFSQGRRTPAEFSSELKEFENLAAKYGETDSESAADALLTKAILYQEVFQDRAGAQAIADQIKPRFPHTQVAAKLGAFSTPPTGPQTTPTSQDTLVVGAKFPDFEVLDLNGEALSLGTRPAKFIMLNFWASTSIDSVQDLPKLLSAYKRYREKGFEVIGISLDTDRESLMELTREFAIPWPQHLSLPGSENDLGRKFGIGKLPANFLLDGQGKILARDFRGGGIEQAVADAFLGQLDVKKE